MKKTSSAFFIGVCAAAFLLIIFLATGLYRRFFDREEDAHPETRIIIPRESFSLSPSGYAELMTWDENLVTRLPLEDGEVIIAVLNREGEEGLAEEQFAAYYNASDPERRVYITYISYNEEARRYMRLWNEPTAATRTETISLFSQDLIGDRNNCIVVTGMNSWNEHTITIFRRSRGQSPEEPFKKIAELQIDGSIVIQEQPRSIAYQQGITTGASFNIAAYGQDRTSSNLLDQIEIIYSYNLLSNQYEQTRISQIPGSQIEQRMLRELLSGAPGVFENYIHDLWYYVSPQGTVDTRRYMYFDPAGREVIFYNEEAQQIFQWQTSTPTRYGLYIRSQNISISTLLRFIDIELESLDSIKLRVVEDVRLRITAMTEWDGSYRRAGTVVLEESKPSINPLVNAQYESSAGRFIFDETGGYSISSGSSSRSGRYVFYTVNSQRLLEMRSDEGKVTAENRLVYKVEEIGGGVLILTRVRLGTAGITDLYEPPITLTPMSSEQ